MKQFRIEPYGDLEKYAEVSGPGSIRFRYDLDDVGYDAEIALPELVKILNDNWTEKLQAKIDEAAAKKNAEDDDE